MSNQWFRLYTEIMYDAKVLVLTEALRWRYVTALCLHCENKLVNRPDDEIALSLRVTLEEWQETKEIFIKRGLLLETLEPAGWNKRQYISDVKDSTAADRQKRYRERKRNDRNATVTSRLPEADTDTDTDIKKEVEGSVQDDSVTPPPTLKSKPALRATRLPTDWELPVPWGEWALEQGMTREAVLREEEKFRDFWISKSGADASKSNWEATWRNWIRRHLEGYGR